MVRLVISVRASAKVGYGAPDARCRGCSSAGSRLRRPSRRDRRRRCTRSGTCRPTGRWRRPGPTALGALGVEVEDLVAGDAVGEPVDDRGREVLGRRAGAREDDLGDLLAVDRLRDRGTTERTLFTREVRETGRDRERLEDRRGLVDRTVAELVLVGRERRAGGWRRARRGCRPGGRRTPRPASRRR